jgi:hypothetical protein
VFLLVSMLLSLAMLPLTIIQLQALFGFGERPFRADYLVFVWSAVPWWWRLRDPFAFLRPSAWRAASTRLLGRLAGWWRALRRDPVPVARATARRARAWGRAFVGIDAPAPPPPPVTPAVATPAPTPADR